tara:strand:+ start:4428 stop:4670 length:243 start_codon:yes stop_codon:yes gene_type:complete
MAIHTHEPEESSHIKRVAYDDATQILSVTYDHDRLEKPKVYHHKVPLAVANTYFRVMNDGYSAGQYYHKFLKGFPKVEVK